MYVRKEAPLVVLADKAAHDAYVTGRDDEVVLRVVFFGNSVQVRSDDDRATAALSEWQVDCELGSGMYAALRKGLTDPRPFFDWVVEHPDRVPATFHAAVCRFLDHAAERAAISAAAGYPS